MHYKHKRLSKSTQCVGFSTTDIGESDGVSEDMEMNVTLSSNVFETTGISRSFYNKKPRHNQNHNQRRLKKKISYIVT